MPPALELHDVRKTFPGQVALKGVDLVVEPGEVHALVGHNGSGKSTLIKVLAGFHAPDPGTGSCEIAGTPVRLGDTDAVRRLGVRFIHQGLGLLDGLTVLENLRLGPGLYQTAPGWRIRWRRERVRVRRALERVGMAEVSAEEYVRNLTAIQKTGVAICRALYGEENASVFVFDEPTATLPDDEVERLFTIIRQLAARGAGVVYVSHRLEEIYSVADQVTVLREGEVIALGPVSTIPRDRLVALITGTSGGGQDSGPDPRLPPQVRPVPNSRSAPQQQSDSAALELSEVVSKECAGLSFTIRPGEVLGLAGLAGSGVHDVPALLLGQSVLRSGSIRRLGAEVHGLNPRQLRRLGMAVLPAAIDQKAITSMSVRENVTLCSLGPYYRNGLLRHRVEFADVIDDLHRFEVRPVRPDMPLASLSGGNRQKVCVAKWLRTSPQVLVLDEPTQGVDVGGKEEILKILKDAAHQQNVAIVVCSSDLDDLEGLCDRVLVVRRGRVTDELTGREIVREEILRRSYAD
jgi:ribose transport system ATP-binding protein